MARGKGKGKGGRFPDKAPPMRSGTATVRVHSEPGRVELHLDAPEPTQHAELILNQASLGEFVRGLLAAGLRAGFPPDDIMRAMQGGG